MLDYEIIYYRVRWYDGMVFREARYDCEEVAIAFIKENRGEWVEYSLTKVEKAIIDF